MLPTGVPQWYNEPRIKLRSLVQIHATVLRYRLNIFRGVIGLVMLLSSCLNIPSKYSVPAELVQCRK